MGYFRPQDLRDPAERERDEDVRLLLMVSETNLRLGRHRLLRVPDLERVARDETLPPRARRRAAVVLARVGLAAPREQLPPRTGSTAACPRAGSCG